MSLFRTTTPFLQNNAWTHQAVNALRYNTSQVGSVVPLAFGTVRQPVNLLALGGYRGPNGSKKGGTGALPLGGTSQTTQGKGGGSGKSKSSKKGSGDFSVDVAFGLCQGPITFDADLLVFANAQSETFGATKLHFYTGADGQAADHTFAGIGSGVNYSGTCYTTGTPMDLGKSPAVPNISFELKALHWDSGGPNFPFDANPAAVVLSFLTDARYGAGFPIEHLDFLDAGALLNTFGDYCAASGLLISVSLDGQQRAAQWLDGLAKLLNTAIVCSGELLKFMPYGDIAISNNGSSWTPNLVPVYSLTDADFLPWHPHQDGADPEIGQDDPIEVARTNPADAFNWFSIEYLDRDNFYNSTILAVYDQSAIDLYGLRIGDSLSGKCFATAGSAQVAAQLYLQRIQFIRNTYRFQIGWDKALLEPMDLVLLTGRGGDNYLVDQAVRVLSIEENDNGDLTVEAEEVLTGHTPPVTAAGPTNPTPSGPELPPANFDIANGAWGGNGNWGSGNASSDTAWFPFTGSPGHPGYPVAAGVTTSGPSVVVAIICYQNYYLNLCLDPTVQNVTSPSLGTFTRRSTNFMYPEWWDRYDPVLGDTTMYYRCEVWWAPAPDPLTNEVVTMTWGSCGPILGGITVFAVEGFSSKGIQNPWDVNATLMNANWNTDPQTVGVPHLYTNHARGALLQYGVISPMKNFPQPLGYDYRGLTFDMPGGTGASVAVGPKLEGLPAGAMGYQSCVSVYGTQFNNAEVEGNIFTLNHQPGVWPQWMMIVDALFFS